MACLHHRTSRPRLYRPL